MRLEIASISPRRGRLKSAPAQALVDEYVQRSRRYASLHTASYPSEADLLSSLDAAAARVPVALWLMDSRGEALTSESFAERLGRLRDNGIQATTLAIGPPDGWSHAARQRAGQAVAFGAITLPHELALVVLSEQIYRTLTIWAGHPYHSGHG